MRTLLPSMHARTLYVRPIAGYDRQRLIELFDGLSPESRLARFLSPKRRLTEAELRYLTDVDHDRHVALVVLAQPADEMVAVARFIRDRHDPRTAEVAVAVRDDWQHQGVGSMLVRRLADRAMSDGITTFTALVGTDNVRSRRLMDRIGHPVVIDRHPDAVAYRVALRPASGTDDDDAGPSSRAASVVLSCASPTVAVLDRTAQRWRAAPRPQRLLLGRSIRR